MATVADKAAAAASDAVNEMTAAVGNVSINDQKDAAQASAAEGRRLYIGNLAYATTEDELKQSFAGFTVESVAIPKNPRNDRPVGYAFVDLATAEEAERAIAELSGKEILERKVSVQLARAPATQAEKAERAEHDGRRRPSTRGRGGNRGRGRFSRGGRHAVEHKEHGSDEHSNEVKPLGDITNKKPVDRAHNDKPMGNFRRERGPPSDGIPSKTKVMVANLPYDLTEDKLREIFAPYEPSMTKIALRPIPRFVIEKLQARGEPRKGRGFGFVTLGSEELQKRAVAEMNGVEIDGREIAVKVAIDSPDKIEADAKSAAAVTAAPAQAAVEATA